MKSIIEANTLLDVVTRLRAGHTFRSGHHADNGNRYYLQYDGLTELYWLFQVGSDLRCNWVHGIAKDWVYTQNMFNESQGGGWQCFALADVVFDEVEVSQ